MSCISEIQTASTPQQALLVIAKYIDALHAKLDTTPAQHADAWGEWAASPSQSEDYVPDPGARADAINALRVKLADADPEEARAIDAQIRLLKEQGESLVDPTPEGRREQVTVTDTEILIETPSPSIARVAARAKWAEGKELHTFFPMWKNDAEGFVRVFVKGGPLWMYHGDRDAIMQMPYEWRRDLVEDIMHDSPATAQEVGRDILKVQTEQQRDYVEALGG